MNECGKGKLVFPLISVSDSIDLFSHVRRCTIYLPSKLLQRSDIDFAYVIELIVCAVGCTFNDKRSVATV